MACCGPVECEEDAAVAAGARVERWAVTAGLAALVTALFVGLPAELRDLSWTSVRGSSSATKTQTLDNDGRHLRITGPNCVAGTAFMSYERGFANGAAGDWGVAPVKDPARIPNDYCARS